MLAERDGLELDRRAEAPPEIVLCTVLDGAAAQKARDAPRRRVAAGCGGGIGPPSCPVHSRACARLPRGLASTLLTATPAHRLTRAHR